jgi:hypothetical protein
MGDLSGDLAMDLGGTADNYKAKLMRRMLPPPYRSDFASTIGVLLTVIGRSDNIIGGLFGSADFLPDEG